MEEGCLHELFPIPSGVQDCSVSPFGDRAFWHDRALAGEETGCDQKPHNSFAFRATSSFHPFFINVTLVFGSPPVVKHFNFKKAQEKNIPKN